MLDAKSASALEQIIMDPFFKKNICLEEQKKGPDGRPISPWKTDSVHDLRILPGSWRS